MGTLGPDSGLTFTDDATVGTIAWSNPGNAAVSDSTNATCALLITQVSHYLNAQNFTFTIPTDATIAGVTVKITRSTTAGIGISDTTVKLIKGGVVGGTNLAAGGTWGTGSTVVTYGSSTNLWGLTLAPSDINATNFGVVINVTGGATDTAQVDFISITIDYVGSGRVSTGSHVTVGTGLSRNEFN